MAILASEALLCEKNPVAKCYPGGNRTQAPSDSKSNTIYTNLTYAYKTETLGSLYSHALLILLKSSKSKHQVVHEQKFKDLLRSTCQVSVGRIVLDLESEAAWVLFQIGVTFCHWIFFM